MIEESRFTTVFDKLQEGKVICKYSDNVAFEELGRDDFFADMNSYLGRIGKMIITTANQSGYYSIYKSVQSAERRGDCRRQFQENINDIEPLSRWLALAMVAQGKDFPMRAGDTLRQSDLLSSLESSPPLIEELSLIARSRLFKTARVSPAEQVTAILKKLTTKGYFIEKSGGLIFIATGKWDRFYDQAEFIDIHEKLDSDDPYDDQSEMPL